MARGRRGTPVMKAMRIPTEQLVTQPQMIEPSNREITHVEANVMEAERDLAYVYVSLTEAIASTEDVNEKARLSKALQATTIALLALGVDIQTDAIIRDCLA